jgi:hypothetical protein
MTENNIDVTGAQVEAAAPVDNNQDEHADQAPRQVPLAALESERAQRQSLQDELRMEHLSLMTKSACTNSRRKIF